MTPDVPPCPHGREYDTMAGLWLCPLPFGACEPSEFAEELRVQDQPSGEVHEPRERPGHPANLITDARKQEGKDRDGAHQVTAPTGIRRPPVADQAPEHDGEPRPVSRTKWLQALAGLIRAGRGEFKSADLYLAWVFTEGHFRYSTGIGEKHQTQPQVATRAGVSVSAVEKFIRRCVNAGLLAEQGGKAKSLGRSRPTPLYRLTLPEFTYLRT